MFLSYFRNLRTFGEKKYLQEVLTFFGETYFLRSYKKTELGALIKIWVNF